MILCSCTRLNTQRLRAALTRTCAEDPWQVVTPGQAFRLTNLRISCGRCAPLVADEIARVLADLQAETQVDVQASSDAEAAPPSSISPPSQDSLSHKGPSHEG